MTGNEAMTSNPGMTIAFGALIVWGVYRRIRRNIGRQPLRPARSIISLVILGLVSWMVVNYASANPNALLAFGGGALLGAILGVVGLRLTKFETTSEGHFYIPNTHIGIVLSALFIGRLAYKYFPIFLHGENSGGNTSGLDAQGHPLLFQSPLTVFILGLTIGYYFVYRVGILIHMRDKIGGGSPKPPAINPPSQ
jgi:hypothetical protein